MNLVHASKTDEYPRGLSHTVSKELYTMCNPKDRITKVEAMNALRHIRMKKEAKPGKFITQLKAPQTEYYGDITDEMLINEVMSKAPAKYQSVIALEARRKGTNLKLEDLKDAMNELYRMVNNSSTNAVELYDNEDQGELMANAFQGECYNCGRRGHSAIDCPLKTSRNRNSMGQSRAPRKNFRSKRGGFNGTCNNCGMRGHMKKDCWKMKANKHKRPNFRRSSSNRREVANPKVEDNELSMVCVECNPEGKEIDLFCSECNEENNEEKM